MFSQYGNLFYICIIINNIPVYGFLGGDILSTFRDISDWVRGEVCNDKWVPRCVQSLDKELNRYVFGQHIALDTISIALENHSTLGPRKKPLVLSFHGCPGNGKGYVADFIVKYFYTKGDSSQFVKKYIAKLDFPSTKEVLNYQIRLRNDLEETVRKCPKALFIFDEVNDFPPKVLDGIKPYLDTYTTIHGLDFRESIFIFISNSGQQEINEITLKHLVTGSKREALKLRDFEHIIKDSAFRDEGGFNGSNLIRDHVMDYVVPFLPLERIHVEMCIHAELARRQLVVDPSIISEIMENILFLPEDVKLFSDSGCKYVGAKVNIFISEETRKAKKLLNPEL